MQIEASTNSNSKYVTSDPPLLTLSLTRLFSPSLSSQVSAVWVGWSRGQRRGLVRGGSFDAPGWVAVVVCAEAHTHKKNIHSYSICVSARMPALQTSVMDYDSGGIDLRPAVAHSDLKRECLLTSILPEYTYTSNSKNHFPNLLQLALPPSRRDLLSAQSSCPFLLPQFLKISSRQSPGPCLWAVAAPLQINEVQALLVTQVWRACSSPIESMRCPVENLVDLRRRLSVSSAKDLPPRTRNFHLMQSSRSLSQSSKWQSPNNVPIGDSVSPSSL